jgi:PAS domain S-box-containing protein
MKVDSLLQNDKIPAVHISKVLIADASVDDSAALGRLLRQHWGTGVQVITATTILDALREYRHEKPDCIIIDHRLADGEGVELLHMLKDVEAPLPAPSIYLASSDGPRLAVRVLKAGAMDFLSKSWVETESLVHAIEKTVESVQIARARHQRRLDVEEKSRALGVKMQALEKSLAFAARVASRAQVFLYVQDVQDDRSIFVNQTLLDGLQYTQSQWDALGRGAMLQIVHPDDSGAFFEHAERMSRAKDGEVYEFECRLQKRDGSWARYRVKESVFQRAGSGLIEQIIGTAEEPGNEDSKWEPLKVQAAAWEHQLAELKSVWNQDAIGIAMGSTSNTDAIKLNPLLAGWLNLEQETDLDSLAHAFGFTAASSSFGKVLAKGVPLNHENRVVQFENGGTIHLRETVEPTNMSGGQSTGFVAYFMRAPEKSAPVTPENPSRDKLIELEAKLNATEASLRMAEERSEESAALVDRLQTNSEPTFPAEADPEWIARAKQAEERLTELDGRWRETLSLLLTADRTRDELLQKNANFLASAETANLEFEAQRQESNELRQRLAEQHAEVEATRRDLESREADIRRLAGRLEENEIQNRDLNTRLHAAEARAQEIEEIEAERDAALQARAEIDATIAERMIDLSEKSRLLAHAEDAKRSSDEHGLRVLDELASSAEQNQALSLALERASFELSEAISQGGELVKTVEHLQANVADLEARALEYEIRRERMLLQESQLRELAQEQATVLLEMAESQIEAQKEMEALAQTAEETLASLEDQRLQVLNLQEALTSSLAESERLAEELTDSAATTQSLSKELEESRRLLEEHADASLEIDRKNLEISKLSDQLQRVESQLQASQTRLHEGEERWWKTYKDAESRENERADAVKELELVKLELGEAQDEIAMLKAVQVTLRQKDEAARLASAQIKNLETEVARLANVEADLLTVSQNLSAVESDRKNRDAQLGRLEERLITFDQREIALLEASQEVVSLKAQLLNSSEAMQAASKGAADQRSRTEELQRAKAEVEERITLASGTLDKLKESLAIAERERDAATARLGETDEEIHRELARTLVQVALLSDAKDSAEAGFAEIASKIADLETDSKRLEIALSKSETVLDETRSELKTSRSELEKAQEEVKVTTKQLEKGLETLAKSEVERKQAQTSLLQEEAKLLKANHAVATAEERYRALAVSVPCIVFSTNSLGVVEYVNDRWAELTGLSMAEAQEGRWKEVIHPDDFESFFKAWTGGIRSGEAYSMQLRVKRKDRVYRWHILQNIPEHDGARISRWLGTLSEIHEQVSSREAAKQARMRYGALLDTTKESTVFLSSSGFVLGASKASLDLLKHGSEAIVGTPFWETKWWLKTEEAKLEDGVRRAAAGNVCEVDTIRVDHERQHRSAKVAFIPVKDENEQVAMLITQFFDI